jgi:type IV secretion system protein VirD4
LEDLVAAITYIISQAGYAVIFAAILAVAIASLRQQTKDETATAHGTARWASRIEARRAGLFSNDGLVLGRWPSRILKPLIRIQTEKHLLTIAPTRAGKGVGTIIPNLLTYRGSAFVIDPKGENARATAVRRKAMGQTVHVLDPWNITSLGQARFNPMMMMMDANSVDLAEDAALIAEALVPSNAGTAPEAFWEEEAKALLAGLLLYIVTHEPPALRTLPRLRELLTMDAPDFQALIEFMGTSNAANGLVARCANRHRQKPERERASVVSSAQAHTHFLDSPRIQATLAHSDFQPADLKAGPVTVYLVLPANRLHSYARWLRLVVNCLLSGLSDNPTRTSHPVLFILDEFPALGRLASVETALGLMAGFGVQLWPIVQDLAQLKHLYPDRWASFLANAGAIQAFGVNDPMTADTLSKFLGTRTVSVKNRTEKSGGNGSADTGSSYSVVGRPLLYPAELRTLPKSKQLLLIDGLMPLLADRITYFADRDFLHLRHGTAWPHGAAS